MTTTPTTRGRGGRRTNIERTLLEQTSHTYRSGAGKVRENRGNVVIGLARLSTKTEMSMGDKSQQEEVIELMKADGVDISNVEWEFEVGSAWKRGKHRPVIDRILDRCEAGEIAAIYVYEVSRLTRDLNVANTILNVIQPNGVAIRIVKSPQLKPENDDMMNQMIFQLLVQQAKSESDATSHRTLRGQKSRAKHGIKRGGLTPFGLRTVLIEHELREIGVPVFEPDTDLEEGLPAEFPTPAELVREMFRRASAGDGTTAIARWLNSLHVPTRGGAAHWNNKTVKVMLRNPLYAGYGTFHGEIVSNELGTEVAPHTPLITPAEWSAVQVVMASRARGPRERHNGYRLSGVLRCGHCQHSMSGRTAGRRHKNGQPIPSYDCPVHNDSPETCNGNNIKAVSLDQVVYKILLGLIQDPEKLRDLTASTDNGEDDQYVKDRDALLAKIASIESRIEEEADDEIKSALGLLLDKHARTLEKLGARAAARFVSGKMSTLSMDELMAAWNSEDRTAAQMIVRGVFAAIEISPTTACPRMNGPQLANAGWVANLYRITLVFHNGTRVNLADAAQAEESGEDLLG